MSNSNTAGKIMLWIGAGCFLLAVCIVAGFILGFGGLVWLVREPQNVTVDIDSPVQVQLGDPVQIIVRVTNTSPTSTELSSIDIGAGYLDGFVILSSMPEYVSFDEYPGYFGEEDYQSYYFYQPIASGETLTITFHGEAVAAGDFHGLFDVCVGSDISCLENTLRTIVE